MTQGSNTSFNNAAQLGVRVLSATPEGNWNNPNGVIFGAWTMYHLILAARAFAQQEHGDEREVSIEAESIESDALSLSNMRFLKPLYPDQPISFYAKSSKRGINVVAMNGDEKVASAIIDIHPEFPPAYLSAVLEMVSAADAITGLKANGVDRLEDFSAWRMWDHVYVTNAVENFQLRNIGEYTRHETCVKLFDHERLERFNRNLFNYILPYMVTLNDYQMTPPTQLSDSQQALEIMSRNEAGVLNVQGRFWYYKTRLDPLIKPPIHVAHE